LCPQTRIDCVVGISHTGDMNPYQDDFGSSLDSKIFLLENSRKLSVPSKYIFTYILKINLTFIYAPSLLLRPYNLPHSRSERIVWFCFEEIKYFLFINVGVQASLYISRLILEKLTRKPSRKDNEASPTVIWLQHRLPHFPW